jgi:mannitol/fructose-specific phosphotransferase system IIA component (Ntr-type)
MQISRYLKEQFIKMELETIAPLLLEGEEDFTPKQVADIRDRVIYELAELLDKSGKVSSVNKLYIDLLNREKQSSTAVGRGLAIPHVRTKHAREMTLAIARSTEGLPWNASDDAPVHIFIAIVCPPYDDKLYLKLYPEIAKKFHHLDIVQHLLYAQEPGEFIRIFTLY